MGILRDPLHPKGAAPTQAASGGTRAAPKYNRRSGDSERTPFGGRRATDGLGEDSHRYPAAKWPVGTREERIHLLDEITADLRAGRIDPIGAYHERLRWAFRCMKEGV